MSTTLSCGQCGSPLRPDQSWCSLCYATIQPIVDPLTSPLDEVIGLDASLGEVVEDTARETLDEAVEHQVPPEPLAEPKREVDTPALDVSEVDIMLSMLAAEHRQSEPAAGLAERFGDRSTRMAVMVGGTAVVGLILFGILTALGALV